MTRTITGSQAHHATRRELSLADLEAVVGGATAAAHPAMPTSVPTASANLLPQIAIIAILIGM